MCSFTLDPVLYNSGSDILVDAAGGLIQVLRGQDTHVYLGSRFPGNLRNRGKVSLANRLRCAWAKYNKFKGALTNRHVDLALRLRLFDSVVTPTALYGLTTTPLTKADLEKLASTQRHMLRCMAGFVKLETDDWNDMYRRVNAKVSKAIARRPIRQWSTEIHKYKVKLHTKLHHQNPNTLLGILANWKPKDVVDDKFPLQPKRSRGRPLTTWDQFVN